MSFAIKKKMSVNMVVKTKIPLILKKEYKNIFEGKETV